MASRAALGDLLVFVLFPCLGMANHDTNLSFSVFLRTVLPFTAAWGLIALLAGAYAPQTLRSVKQTLVAVPSAWLLAGVVGISVRVLLFDRPFVLSFAIVAIGLTGTMLIAWRVVLATITKR